MVCGRAVEAVGAGALPAGAGEAGRDIAGATGRAEVVVSEVAEADGTVGAGFAVTGLPTGAEATRASLAADFAAALGGVTGVDLAGAAALVAGFVPAAFAGAGATAVGATVRSVGAGAASAFAAATATAPAFTVADFVGAVDLEEGAGVFALACRAGALAAGRAAALAGARDAALAPEARVVDARAPDADRVPALRAVVAAPRGVTRASTAFACRVVCPLVDLVLPAPLFPCLVAPVVPV